MGLGCLCGDTSFFTAIASCEMSAVPATTSQYRPTELEIAATALPLASASSTSSSLMPIGGVHWPFLAHATWEMHWPLLPSS